MSPELATELNEEVLAKLGEYSNHYETLGPIGHGAFGFVKLASRREDGELVSLNLAAAKHTPTNDSLN